MYSMHGLIHAFLWLQGWLSVGYLCQKRVKGFSIKYGKLHGFRAVSQDLRLIGCSNFDLLRFLAAGQVCGE